MVSVGDKYRYAVKRIPFIPSEERKKYHFDWEFEAAKASELNDSHILKVNDYYKDDNHFYIVYDHYTEGTLRDFYSNPTIPSGFNAKQVFFYLTFIFS